MRDERQSPDVRVITDGQRDQVFWDLIQVGQSTIIEDTYTLTWPDGESRTFKRRFLVALVDKIKQP